jgi:hypothetical protein
MRGFMDVFCPHSYANLEKADLRNRSATVTGEVERHLGLALEAVDPCLDALLVHEIVVRKSWCIVDRHLSVVPVPVETVYS